MSFLIMPLVITIKHRFAMAKDRIKIPLITNIVLRRSALPTIPQTASQCMGCTAKRMAENKLVA
uniref:Secreted protein n=1 Tax=Heterorhabditis bacteriophora TaxID=37862 RepID=A0A1I7WC48_HETBA